MNMVKEKEETESLRREKIDRCLSFEPPKSRCFGFPPMGNKELSKKQPRICL